MEQKIAQLTEAIYREGVERAQTQAQQTLTEAQEQAKKIVDAARSEAEALIAAAQAQTEELKKNSASEMKLAGQQAISSIKQQITDLILTRAVDVPVGSVLSEPAHIKEYIAAIIKSWGHQNSSAEVILPEGIRDSMDKQLAGSIAKLLHEGVSISYAKNFKGGFQIKPAGQSYKISLTDEDFSAFFKEYLRPKTRSLLFGE